MQISDLATLAANTQIETDLVIIGGGPAGLTLAREFFDTRIQVLILESGRRGEESPFAVLNAVESIGEPSSEAQRAKRIAFHGHNSPSWSHDVQQFGVRCRALGGSTHAWAGKSAAFSSTDFDERPWVPHSGWPFGKEALAPYLDRAAAALNLGLNCYDDQLWEAMGLPAPEPALDPELLKSFFWQFSRSRIDPLDIMRFGSEFEKLDAPNVRVLLNATVTQIETNEDGQVIEGVEIATIDGVRSSVKARAVVLAASGIENPRLLLTSNKVHSAGLGNGNDLVGRYLMDHPSARLGRFLQKDCAAINKRFGFYGVEHEKKMHMYMHGLTMSEALQRQEHLLHCAVYMLEERAPDDPWEALKRLLRVKSGQPASDILALLKSPGLLIKGAGMKAFQSGSFPTRLRQRIVDTVIRYNPNFAVHEFQSRGLPYKLTGIMLDGITEQCPDPESRITLSDRTDALGVPMAKVDWRIDMAARRSLVQLGRTIAAEFPRANLPAPVLEDWVAQNRPEDSVIIDMGHSLGTTRMSDDPKAGVVDANCKMHGVNGLYIAGGSVFPTSGHANPTLMILALAIRLADRIKLDLTRINSTVQEDIRKSSVRASA